MKALVPFLALLISVPSALMAQDVVRDRVVAGDRTDLFLAEPNFWMAIVTGIFLAIAFQLVLTTLAAAIGLSAFDVRPGKPKDKSGDTMEITGPKITSAFGLFTMLTTGIGLFFASWLGVSLGMTDSVLNGVITGLVIWALFMTLMTLMEARVVSSLVGSLVSVASAGLKTGYGAVTSMFSKAPEDKAVDAATKIVEEVRNELFGGMDAGDLKSQIQKYVNQLSKPKIDASSIRHELENLLDDVEIKAVIDDPSMLRYEEISASLEINRGMSKQKAKAVTGGIKQAIDSIRDERSKDKRPAEKAVDSVARVAGMDAGQAEEYRRKIEDYLRSTDKEALNPEGIKADFEKMFESPAEGVERLKDRLAQLDRDTIADIISQRTDMSKEEVMNKTDAVVNTLTMVKNKISGKAQAVGSEIGAGPTTSSQADIAVGATSADKNSVITKIFDYAHSWQMPDLDYDGIKHDISTMFSDPKAGAEAIKNRLQGIDRETMKKIVQSKKDIGDEEAERIVQQMESARDSVVEKAENMKNEVEKRLKLARDEALRKADDARKTAATAAWWVFGTSVVSGIAAVLGAIAAIP